MATLENIKLIFNLLKRRRVLNSLSIKANDRTKFGKLFSNFRSDKIQHELDIVRILKMPSSSNAYRTMISRFQDRLINYLFLIDLRQDKKLSPQVKDEFHCFRYY